MEQTTPISSRIPENLLHELIMELKRTGKKKSEWVKEAVEEKLQNDNSEILDAEINFLKSKLQLLEKSKLSIKEKVENINKIPEHEIPLLIKSKQIIDRDPTFIKGQISLYKNQFGKTYKISEQDFYELLQNAESQYKLKEI